MESSTSRSQMHPLSFCGELYVGLILGPGHTASLRPAPERAKSHCCASLGS